jgi:hypothetical protein
MWYKADLTGELFFVQSFYIVATCWSLEIWQIFYFFGNLTNLDFVFKNPLLMLMYPSFFFTKWRKFVTQRKKAANAHYVVEIKRKPAPIIN